MYQKINGKMYDVQVNQKCTHDSGTAEWKIEVYKISDYKYNAEKGVNEGVIDPVAVVTVETGEIIGQPVVKRYMKEIESKLTDLER